MNELEFGAGIDPGMDFNPFASSILDKTRLYLNPKPLDRELSPLTTRPDLPPIISCANNGQTYTTSKESCLYNLIVN
jgi:hypothetical protein